MEVEIRRREAEELAWLQMKREEYSHMAALTARYNDESNGVWKRWLSIVERIIRERYGA